MEDDGAAAEVHTKARVRVFLIRLGGKAKAPNPIHTAPWKEVRRGNPPNRVRKCWSNPASFAHSLGFMPLSRTRLSSPDFESQRKNQWADLCLLRASIFCLLGSMH